MAEPVIIYQEPISNATVAIVDSKEIGRNIIIVDGESNVLVSLSVEETKEINSLFSKMIPIAEQVPNSSFPEDEPTLVEEAAPEEAPVAYDISSLPAKKKTKKKDSNEGQ